MNLLLQGNKFIPFGNFTYEDLEEALNECLKNSKTNIYQLEELSDVTWEQINQLLHLPLYKLNQIWGLVNHLLAVSDNEELRKLQAKFQPLITEFYVNLGQNERIYQHYKLMKETQADSLDIEAKKVIENEFRDFFLSGITLKDEQKEQFKQIQNQLNELSTKFEQNLLDATDSYAKYVTKEELSGIPEDILELFAKQSANDGKEGLYKLSLHMPSYLPVMQYCDNRTLREELYYQYVTRASELGKPELDNTKIIYQILALRQQKAKLLEFKDYTELSLYTKMADNAQQILDFLHQLAQKSKNSAIKDMEELREFAVKSGISKLESWDIPYFSEKLQQEKYSYSNNELKQYFQLPVVLNGLFKLINQLYKVEFIPTNGIPIWHSDMQTFKVVRDNKEIGYLYLDLFARNGKQSGAWMNSAQDRFSVNNHYFEPMAYVLCNFTPPVNNIPSLLTFDEVQTLFHEMGHALHHLLSTVNHFSISGINGVEWDAVELPSQFMEYFAWNYEILTNITQHIKTGESIPQELYNKLLNSRHFQSGLAMLRQLEFAIFDLMLHLDLSSNLDYLALLDQVRQEVSVFTPPHYNRFPNTFSHIFAGGYASGYYSYKWAEVLATDIFAVFDDADISEYSELGNKFYTTVLSQGGLRPMLDNFKAFMGRIPQIEALLKYSGISA